jgi:hypothetical protein
VIAAVELRCVRRRLPRDAVEADLTAVHVVYTAVARRSVFDAVDGKAAVVLE